MPRPGMASAAIGPPAPDPDDPRSARRVDLDPGARPVILEDAVRIGRAPPESRVHLRGLREEPGVDGQHLLGGGDGIREGDATALHDVDPFVPPDSIAGQLLRRSRGMEVRSEVRNPRTLGTEVIDLT